jgi:hypothetical protein
MAEPKYYRVRTKDRIVWVNPDTREPLPNKLFVSDSEPGFEEQRHKCFPEPLTQDEVQKMLSGTVSVTPQIAPPAPTPPTPVHSAPATKVGPPPRAAYRRV